MIIVNTGMSCAGITNINAYFELWYSGKFGEVFKVTILKITNINLINTCMPVMPIIHIAKFK